MTIRTTLACLAAAVLLGGVALRAADDEDENGKWTETFAVEPGELSATGRNPYFILEPGYQLAFEGRDKGKPVALVITVLDETKTVDGVETRVVEERETTEGQPVEVSRNFFAISRRTNSVYYFGEEVDIYKDGKVFANEGAWLSGKAGAKFGLAMPGQPLIGARYYQELAPKVAMDRAEVLSLTGSMETPAGKFENVLVTEETTPLEPDDKERKYYAAGVGLIKDGPMKLVRHGFLKPR
jgi:hypothetical protein